MKYLVLVLLTSFTFFVNAQQEERIKEIEEEIKIAVEKSDYEKAAELKKEKEIRVGIQEAVDKGDYEEAARLKKELAKLPEANSDKIKELEAEKQKAVEAEDYEKAAKLQKEIDKLKNGEKSETSENNSSTTLDPEFVNQVYLINNSNLEKLEKQKGEIKTSTSAAPFYASSTSFYYIPGTHSTKTVKSNAVFVVKVFDGIDPSDIIRLVKFKAGKDDKDRYVPYYKYSSGGYIAHEGSSKNEMTEHLVELNFSRLHDDVFKITIDGLLKNGEYGFIYNDKFFCFRVGNAIEDDDDTGEVQEEKKENDDELSRIMKNGFYFDGLLGFGVEYYTGVGVHFGFRIGSKYYFTENSFWRPGIQVVWGRLGFMGTFGNMVGYLAPVNVGFANAFEFKKNLGMEANLNAGFATMYTLDDVNINFLVGPEVKFRYKKIAAGIDIAQMVGIASFNGYLGSATFISATFGIKY